ncbi:hypothetical protein P43SY_002130 [Pythium insidiosum]|uniref:Uncharacterized protein n=1 Tax=Pythium insidiosum TaxID=114742 RepID=A0AAD5QA68_PYTIN|nr:hypothetical protein P43SY_002130 [Pythium insidiosum]
MTDSFGVMQQEGEDGGAMQRVALAAVTAPSDEREWEREYKALKTRFRMLQEDTLALAAEYSAACDELRYEKDCQEELIQQWADIRVRRLRDISRRELRLKLQDEWELLTDKEKALFRWQEWTLKLSRHKKPVKRPSSAKTTRKTSVPASTTSTPKAAGSKEKTPRKTATPKRKLSAESDAPATKTMTKKRSMKADANENDSLPAVISDVEIATPVTTPTKRKKNDGVTPNAVKKRTPPRPKSDGKQDQKKKKATPKTRTQTPSKSKASREPGGRSTPKSKTMRGVKRRLTSSDNDDQDGDNDDDVDVDADDDDANDESFGSASDDDDDERMAHLPTGAFG